MSNKSLEALEILRECANGEKKVLFSTSLELTNTIKQDLKRLECLEYNLDSEKYHLVNENQCLKNRVSDLEISFKELIKENQELKESFKIASNDQIYYRYNELKNEYYKLKKAIEILKRDFQFEIQDDFLWIYDNYCGALETFSLNEDEINLLKEVLE